MTPLRIYSAPVESVVPTPATRQSGTPAALLSAFLSGPGTDRLADPRALMVTTGQQPGLFGGPLYTVHKALAARALARELERRLDRVVVPVFWLAGDDHDWTEASRAAWWTTHDEVRQWALPPLDDAGPQLSMSRTPVPIHDVQRARDQLAADLPAGPNRDQVLDWIDRHWLSGATMASAFAGAISELLAPLGIACLDPTTLAFKQAQTGLLRSALEGSAAIDAALAALPDAGTGISVGEQATLVFMDGRLGRDRLLLTGNGRFVARRSGERFDFSELNQLLTTNPERFSANVLLRPVVEAALLPTLAYVAGPGESRYLTGQAHAVYPILGVTQQAVVPRWSGWVIDPTSERLLQRLDLVAREVIAGDPETAHRLLMGDMPEPTIRAVASLRDEIAAASSVLRGTGQSIDPVLDRAISNREHRLQHITDDLLKLMERHLKKHDGIAWAQYQRLRRRLMPLDRPQERTISVAGAWGRWGREWIGLAAAAADAWAPLALEPVPRKP